MDTIHLEYVAEDFISHKLQQAGILVAKPKFDKKGTDLLAFLEMGDGVKFCRIQCKGRSVVKTDSNIKIPEKYVTSGFVVFLYIDAGNSDGDLYCFFESDITSWNKTSDNEYRLSITKKTFSDKLEFYRFDESKVRLIKGVIEAAKVSGEFRRLVYGTFNITTSDDSAEIHGYVGTPPIQNT